MILCIGLLPASFSTRPDVCNRELLNEKGLGRDLGLEVLDQSAGVGDGDVFKTVGI